jgi:hypothetical protein
MIHRAIPFAALLALPLALRGAGPEAALRELPAERPVLALLPPDALVVLDAPGIAGLAARGLDDPLVRALLHGGVDDLLRAGAGAGAGELLERGDDAVGFPLLATFASLAHGGAALAIDAGRGGVGWTLALRGDDAELLRATLLDGFARLEAQYGSPGGTIDGGRRTVRCADTWRIGDGLALAQLGALFLASNTPGRLEDALERAATAEPPASTLAHALPASSAATVLRAAVDLERLDGLASFGLLPGMRKLRAMHGLPAVQLLLGAGVAELGSARALGFALELDGTRLRARVEGVGTADSGGLSPHAGALAPPALARNEHDVADALVYRDLSAAFRERVDRFARFAPEAMPGFAKAEADLALFFGGEDLARDVLPGISPWMRLVAREIEFAPERRPENTLPAAAVILALDDKASADADRAPRATGTKLATAFQTLIGAVNLQRAQERKPGFLLALEPAGEHTLTTAGLPTPRAADGIDLAYNLEPACAQVGDLFVLATHAALARQLVLELGPGRAEVRADLTERWSLEGASAARIVAANRATLVAQNALDKGHSFDAARAEVAALERLVALVDSLRIEVASSAAGGERAVALTLELDVAAAPAPQGTQAR